MPANRLSMRKIKEVLRLKWANDLSDRKIAQSCKIPRRTGLVLISAASPFLVVCLNWLSPITCSPASPRRTVMSPTLTRLIWKWQRIMASRLPGNPKIKPKRRWVYKLLNAGFWRHCASTPSFLFLSLIRRFNSCY